MMVNIIFIFSKRQVKEIVCVFFFFFKFSALWHPSLPLLCFQTTKVEEALSDPSPETGRREGEQDNNNSEHFPEEML